MISARWAKSWVLWGAFDANKKPRMARFFVGGQLLAPSRAIQACGVSTRLQQRLFHFLHGSDFDLAHALSADPVLGGQFMQCFAS